MSTPFYDLASLVVVPSGYKASKVYAQKPLTTDGQLTFSRASTATRVNASGLIETVASNVPRLDYLGSTCPKILLEPQRSNVLTYSSEFDNAAYSLINTTVTANTSVSPDGTQNADTLSFSSDIESRVERSFSVSAGSYTFSFYAKTTTSSNVNLRTRLDFISESKPFVNITVTNQWQRFVITESVGSSTTAYPQIRNAVSAAKDIYIWGAQFEAGAYASSYIPTLGAAVTRSADACSKTGISSLIGQTEGTLFVETTYNGAANSSQFNRIINITDGSLDNFIAVSKNSGTAQLYVYSQVGGVPQVDSSAIANTNLIGTHKIALAYKANDFVLYVDGVQRFTDTSGLVAACSQLNIGGIGALGGGADQLGGSVNQALLFKTRLTNAQLAELTTL